MSEVIVYGVPGSPYVRAALLGFEEKGAPYRLHALGLGEEKTPAHLVRHPFGRVPTIDHDGFALYETQAIIRYVDAAVLRLTPSAQAIRLAPHPSSFSRSMAETSSGSSIASLRGSLIRGGLNRVALAA